jgi:hypothetical protein
MAIRKLMLSLAATVAMLSPAIAGEEIKAEHVVQLLAYASIYLQEGGCHGTISPEALKGLGELVNSGIADPAAVKLASLNVWREIKATPNGKAEFCAAGDRLFH